ncbi:hypothetical protein GCM10027446_15230 [Angustibacter peucedani]
MPARTTSSRPARRSTASVAAAAGGLLLAVLLTAPGAGAAGLGRTSSGPVAVADHHDEAADGHHHDHGEGSPECGGDGQRVVVPGEIGPVRCGHLDEPPPGVDVGERVSTAELRDRDGASAQAALAAQEVGIPSAAASGAVDPAVPCDGDGTTGYRVQAMYVVEAGVTNRYADLLPSIRVWAAGVDDVVNRSAALTSGVRHVRYVTRPSGGGCVADVLNVTVPVGATKDFGSTISAVQALGYSDPHRKYLMWTDANKLCGIGLLYRADNPGQDNANNGSYAQYARVDNGCWGFGDGSTGHSVEAHELVHTLGSVFAGAPHATANGHCWDESDTMCYSDGTSHPMVQVCSSALEYLLDCGSDDYFSTYPDPGSWLALHWNTASSRFLIGGGDGTGGGSSGAPVRLGATIAVNNPAVAGLPTQAEVTPALPTGVTVAKVAWKSARTDCSFDDPTALQAQVTCGATAAAATTVTATITDSTGAVKTVTSPLTFSTASGPRAVTVVTTLVGQSGAAQDVCTGTTTPVLTTVLDVATGLPVKGLRTTVAKKTASGATTTVGALTDASGVARTTTSTSAPVSLLGVAGVTGAFATASASAVQVTPIRCAATVSAEASADATYYGDPVVLSGSVVRARGNGSVPLAGATVQLQEVLASGAAQTLGTAKVADDGTFSGTVKPTTSGLLRVTLPATTGWPAAYDVVGSLAVSLPSTEVTGAADALDVGYASPLPVHGTLTRVAGQATRPVAGATVTVRVTPSTGPAVSLGTAKTAADGTWRLTTAPKVAGRLSAVFAGVSGQPAASADLGALVVGTWTPTVTVTSAPTALVSGSGAKATGRVDRAYGGISGPAPGVAVKLVLQTTLGTEVLLGTATTSSTGTWSLTVAPKESGTLVARVAVPGYVATDADGVDVAVSTRLSVSYTRTVAAGATVLVTVTVAVPRAVGVVVEQLVNGSWTTVASATTSVTGTTKLVVPAASWSRTLRVRTDGDARGGAATSASFVVTAP